MGVLPLNTAVVGKYLHIFSTENLLIEFRKVIVLQIYDFLEVNVAKPTIKKWSFVME